VPKFFWFDDAIINSIYMIEIVSRMSEKVSKVLKDLPTRFFERIEIECSDEMKFEVMNKIKEKAIEKYENMNTIDGVKISFSDSWALIRASNTSPKLRLSIEAKDQRRLDKLKKEMMTLINSILEIH
jgi:phosphomannomutase/phosphoglucomutase